jgi:hypothetical protein
MLYSARVMQRVVREAYLVAPLAAAALAIGAQAFAHHSFAATYLESQSVTIEGELVQFVLRNPHSFVELNVPQPDGTMVRYVVEWGSPSQLKGKITRETLKPGDHLIITGNPGRNTEDHRVRLLTFRRPKDGWSWGLLPDEVLAK